MATSMSWMLCLWHVGDVGGGWLPSWLIPTCSWWRHICEGTGRTLCFISFWVDCPFYPSPVWKHSLWIRQLIHAAGTQVCPCLRLSAEVCPSCASVPQRAQWTLWWVMRTMALSCHCLPPPSHSAPLELRSWTKPTHLATSCSYRWKNPAPNLSHCIKQ